MKYLDYNATTPVHPEVLDEMMPYFIEKFANPASRTHEPGREAASAVEQARSKLAKIFDLDSKYVFFTSGATEANNLAILGLKKYMKDSGKTKIVTSMFEHKAVLDPCLQLKDEGFEVVLIKPNNTGVVDINDFANEIDSRTGLVSLMHVNNELGTVQPVEEVAKIAKNAGAMMHVDGAQGFCKTKIKLDYIDYYSASGHKIYGPKGIGCLFVNGRKARKPLKPIMFGGGHEGGLRPGTLPTPLIVGFAKASEICTKIFKKKNRKQSLLEIFKEIKIKYPEAELNCPIDDLGTTINFHIPGIKSEALLLREKDWALSNGSACTSKDYSPSHVLVSIGVEEKTIKESIRLSY